MDNDATAKRTDVATDRTGAAREEGLREIALTALKKKADFRVHLVVYVLVNCMIVGIWLVTGSGFFWPVFPIAGWGVGLAMHAWDVYVTRPPTEAEVEREMEKLRDKR